MNKKIKDSILHTSLIAISSLMFFSVFYIFFLKNNYLEVYFIDVGQGDCEYIKTPNKKSIVIDGGDKGKGTKILKPFLNNLGISSIDACMATHYHDDHVNGIIEIANFFKIEHLLAPICKEKSSIYENLISVLKKNNIELEYVFKNDIIKIDKEIDFFVLYAGENYSGGNENNNSIVCKILYGNTSFLFTGDIEKNIEYGLSERNDLSSTVLKAAHHGSNTSNTIEFLTKIMPQYTVLEVGKSNKYNHPGPNALKNFMSVKTKLYRTDKNGTIKFLADKNGIRKINVLKEE